MQPRYPCSLRHRCRSDDELRTRRNARGSGLAILVVPKIPTLKYISTGSRRLHEPGDATLWTPAETEEGRWLSSLARSWIGLPRQSSR